MSSSLTKRTKEVGVTFERKNSVDKLSIQNLIETRFNSRIAGGSYCIWFTLSVPLSWQPDDSPESLANQYRERAVTHDPSSKVTRHATWQGHDPRDLTSTLTSLKITCLSFSVVTVRETISVSLQWAGNPVTEPTITNSVAPEPEGSSQYCSRPRFGFEP
jgi:hypothetical protein